MSEETTRRPPEAEGRNASAEKPAVSAERPIDVARDSGLVQSGAPLLVLLSGGGDSVCLLDVAIHLGAHVSALHVNYGLRPGADEDERFVRGLCDGLGARLHVERVDLPGAGNLQDRARDARYALADRHAEADYAAGHTASDQAETVLYRLVVSPGSRALHGMAPRRGRLVRPLLGATRDEVRAYLAARGLGWREDPSNADRRFARSRIRHDVLDSLRDVSPVAEKTIAETARQLVEEAEVLDRSVEDALEELGGGPAVSLSALTEQLPAVRRLLLRRLAELAAGEPRALSREEAGAIIGLGERGTKSLDLGGGLRAVAEYGTLRFTRAPDAEPPAPVTLPVPGRVRFGDWEIEAMLAAPGDVSVRGEALGGDITVRVWDEGDRMRPVGLGGTKTLQDLFTDRKVPRALRHTLPVLESNGEIVWVAGVALGERFAAGQGERTSIGLVARSGRSRG